MADGEEIGVEVAAMADEEMILPDDVLRHLLRFVEAKEGAYTTMLSKRWRPLWPSSGAVNLVARVVESEEQRLFEEAAFFANRDKLIAGAHKALDAFAMVAAQDPLTKLTFRVEGRTGTIIRDFLNRELDFLGRPEVLANVLSHRAAAVLRELRVEAVDTIHNEPMAFECTDFEVDPISFGIQMYVLSLRSLPSDSLQVLDLTNCGQLLLGFAPPFFRKLRKLRLKHCNMPLEDLQSLVTASPKLTCLWLEYVLLEDDRILFQPDQADPQERRVLRLTDVKTIVLYKCCLREQGTLQIYAPMLCTFEYMGILRHISLNPLPEQLSRVDVTLIPYRRKEKRDLTAAGRSFWALVTRFSRIKHFNLRLTHLQGMKVITKAIQGSILPALVNMERLQISLVYSPSNNNAAVLLIASLLGCCPNLCELRINLTTVQDNVSRGPDYCHAFLERQLREETRRAKDNLENWGPMFTTEEVQEPVHRPKRTRTLHEPSFFSNLPGLPGLNDGSFECLHNTLRRVALQFRHGEKSVLGVALLKFFAESGNILEEIALDDGVATFSDHIHVEIEKWITSWSDRIKISPLRR